jgi:hypothetical protein
MAKAEIKEEIKDNIVGLPLLQKEFERGVMIDRKVIALRQKLLDLHTSGMESPSEHNLLVVMLKRDRLKSKITDANTEILNRIEIAKTTEKAYVKVDHPPRVHDLVKDMVCKYYKDNEHDRFIVFVEKTIPPRHQLTEELAYAEERGAPFPLDQYPKAKKQLKRLDLTSKEFHGWFEILDEENDLKPDKVEEAYTF